MARHLLIFTILISALNTAPSFAKLNCKELFRNNWRKALAPLALFGGATLMLMDGEEPIQPIYWPFPAGLEPQEGDVPENTSPFTGTEIDLNKIIRLKSMTIDEIIETISREDNLIVLREDVKNKTIALLSPSQEPLQTEETEGFYKFHQWFLSELGEERQRWVRGYSFEANVGTYYSNGQRKVRPRKGQPGIILRPNAEKEEFIHEYIHSLHSPKTTISIAFDGKKLNSQEYVTEMAERISKKFTEDPQASSQSPIDLIQLGFFSMATSYLSSIKELDVLYFEVQNREALGYSREKVRQRLQYMQDVMVDLNKRWQGAHGASLKKTKLAENSPKDHPLYKNYKLLERLSQLINRTGKRTHDYLNRDRIKVLR